MKAVNVDEVLEIVCRYGEYIFITDNKKYSGMIDEIANLKPLKRKIGHWISHREHCEMNNLRPSGLGSYFWCSECDCGIDSKDFARVNYNYCPHCGADMREVEK